MTTSVVTGGAGFLGSHLVERLLSDGHLVTVIDNLSTGRRENLREHRGLMLMHHDVCRPIPMIQADYVWHLASPASPADYTRMPLETLAAGSIGTLHALELARRNEARFLLASSSEVYGSAEPPHTEDCWGSVNPVGPRSMYDESKRFAEALTTAYSAVHGLSVRIARLFNVYGPRMRPNDGRAVPAFLAQARGGTPLTVFGCGQQTRSFCWVDDTVDGLVRLMDSEHAGPVNIGNPEEIRIDALAALVAKLVGPCGIVYSPLPTDDPPRRRPDISLARELLGWEPQVGIAEGLERLVRA